MAAQIELLLEAERRGILPEDKKGLLDEARRRGLVPEDENKPKYEAGLTDLIYQGATLGFGDEIDAALAATAKNPRFGPGWRKTYDKERALILDAYERYAERHPWLNLGAQAAGGALLPLGAAARGKSFWAFLARGAAAGAATGAAAGVGYAEGGLGERLPEGAMGAGGGAVLGMAMPAGAAAGRSVVRGGLNWLRGPESRAAAEIAKTLDRSGLGLDEAGRRVAEAQGKGVPLAPVDLSRSTRRLGRQIETLPGKPGDELTTFLAERQTGQGMRTLDALKKSMGNDGELYAVADDIMARRASEAAPLYQRAYGGLAQSDRLDALIPRLEASGAFGGAKRIAAIEGGSVGAIPSMKSWDYIKRGLDDQIERYRDKTTGRLVLDDKGRALAQLRQDLLGALDEANPDYAAARAAYAGHSEMLDALDLGRSFMRGDEEMLATRFAKLTPAQQEMFRIGAVRELRGRIEDSPDGADIVRRIFGSPARRQRLRILFPDDQTFEEFSAVMNLEKETTRTARMVTGGSATGRIEAEQNDLVLSGLMDIAIAGRPSLSVLQRMTLMSLRARGLDEPTADIIAQWLTSGAISPAMRTKVLKNLKSNEKFRRTLVNYAQAGGLSSGASFSGWLNGP